MAELEEHRVIERTLALILNLEAAADVAEAMADFEAKRRAEGGCVPGWLTPLLDGARAVSTRSGTVLAGQALVMLAAGVEDDHRESATVPRMLVSYDEAAESLDISKSTVQRLIRDDRLRVVQVTADGRTPRIALAELERFTKENAS